MKKLLLAAVVALLALFGLSTCAGSFLNNNSTNKATTTSSSVESSSATKGSSEASASASSSSATALTKETALAAALADAGIAETDASVTAVEEDTENGTKVFKVDFTSAGQEYEYTLNAETGEIIEKSSEVASETDADETASNQVSSATQEKLIAKAMADAEVVATESTVLGTEVETNDGVQQFDVDFVNKGTRYHYILNAETEEIIETSTSPVE